MPSTKAVDQEKTKWNHIVIFMLFLFPFFEPLSLRYIISSSVGNFFEYIRFILSIIIILVYLSINKESKRISKSVFFLVFFMIAYFVVSLNSFRWTVVANFVVNITAIMMFFEIAMRRKKNVVIISMFYLLFLLTLINLIYLFIQPNGIVTIRAQEFWNPRGYYNTLYDNINFLERDNRLMNWLLPLWFSMMISYYKGYINKMMSLVVMIVIDLTLVLVWSGTSIIGGVIITTTYIVIIAKSGKFKSIKFRNMIGLLAISNILIVGFNIQNLFSFLIEDILGKSLTLTGRTTIWEIAMKMIANSPLVGYGTQAKGYIISTSFGNWYSHNFVLDILIQGGIVLLIAFIILIYSVYNSSSKYKNGYPVKIMLVALTAWGIMGLTESFFYQYSFWISLAVLANVKYIENKNIININHEKNQNEEVSQNNLIKGCYYGERAIIKQSY